MLPVYLRKGIAFFRIRVQLKGVRGMAALAGNFNPIIFHID